MRWLGFLVLLVMACSISQEKSKTKVKDVAVWRELGRELFFDRDISYNQTKSCASCHDPKFAFTDGYRQSTGAEGRTLKRNALPLFNLVQHSYFTYADTSIQSLEVQILGPLFNNDPKELGWSGFEGQILRRLNNKKYYTSICSKLGLERLDRDNFINAIKTFILTIQSYNTRYDRITEGLESADSSFLKGKQLFNSEKLKCAHCHGGQEFNQPGFEEVNGAIPFFNTGLYNVSGSNNYPNSDQGLYDKTGIESDNGRFRVPTLRNIALTGPYFHDGSAQNLSEVIQVYARGGRLIVDGPLAGEGAKNKRKSKLVAGFELTKKEERDLINFLHSLTDSSLVEKQWDMRGSF